MMTPQEIEDVLYGPWVNSTNRVDVLLRLVASAPSNVFWPAFLGGWSSCDATWYRRPDLLFYLRLHHPGHDYLDAAARAFYAATPDLIEVFRGCSRERVRGLSWTTDRAVAEGFARGHRGIPTPRAVVARAMIPKAHVFAACIDRGESEMVLDPRRLRALKVEAWPSP